MLLAINENISYKTRQTYRYVTSMNFSKYLQYPNQKFALNASPNSQKY